MLPVPAIELLDLERRDIDAVEAAHIDVDLVGIGARHIEWMDAARGAERVLRLAGIESISRQRILAADQLELFRRHDEMQKPFLAQIEQLQ